MKIVSWIILYGFIAFFEVSSLVKKKNKKALTMYSVLISLAFVLSMMLAFGVKIPSFNLYIGQIIRSLTGE